MSDTPTSAENLKLPTGKLGQPTTDTAIARATDAVEASKAIAENGPQITHPPVDRPTPSNAVDSSVAATQKTVERAAAPFVDMFQGSARMSAEHLQTLGDTWISLGRGVRDMQVRWLDTIGSAAPVKPPMWQAQRDLYVQGLDQMIEATSRVIALATRQGKESTH